VNTCSTAGVPSSTGTAASSPSPRSSWPSARSPSRGGLPASSAPGLARLHSESAQVAARLQTDFGGGKTSGHRPFPQHDPGADATSAPFQAAIAAVATTLRQDPSVASVVGYAETGNRQFIGLRGDAAYIVVNLNVTDEQSVGIYPALRAKMNRRPDTRTPLRLCRPHH